MDKQQQNTYIDAPKIGEDTRIIDYINAQLCVMNDIDADNAVFRFENDVFRFEIKVKRKAV